jgi:hypothetical protein
MKEISALPANVNVKLGIDITLENANGETRFELSRQT